MLDLLFLFILQFNLYFWVRTIRKLLLVEIQQGYPKEKSKKKIKSVPSGYRDLAIVNKDIQ